MLHDFAFSKGLLPLPVDHSLKLHDVAPSLPSRYRTFLTTTRDSAPAPRFGTLTLTGRPLESLPWHRCAGSHVPHKSPNCFDAPSFNASSRGLLSSLVQQSLKKKFLAYINPPSRLRGAQSSANRFMYASPLNQCRTFFSNQRSSTKSKYTLAKMGLSGPPSGAPASMRMPPPYLV